jgi:hypothetical protein
MRLAELGEPLGAPIAASHRTQTISTPDQPKEYQYDVRKYDHPYHDNAATRPVHNLAAQRP